MLRKTGATTGLAFGLFLCATTPALAGGWGSVDCSSDPSPYCDLNAGRGAHPAPRPGSVPKPGAPKSQAGGRGAAPALPGDRIVGGNSNQADCSYVRSNYQPPANGVQTIRFNRHRWGSGGVQFVSLARPRPQDVVLAQGPGGGWYVYQCSGQGQRDALYRAPVWIPDGQAPGAAPLPSPEELAEQARSQLRLPSPVIGSSPDGTQLVQLPTWLWLDREMWRTQSATASVPGVSVTATAIPASVSWAMGDGSTVSCTGPGTPFPAQGDPRSASPDCGHIYQRSSAGAPAERFPATATVSWRITWSGAGASGTFPDMTTSAAASFRVAEAQALGTG
ncbi:hypothetical protein SD37_39875 [Amycolatopsis orientalis]|uniref:ATP/GTP-binding protein n=1 Tax=Amycolatopsis orientalis TaxID=31958 RepID=A0A193C9Z8_AMYOR|nr:hypothetical protein SD37_39875 [Amycolatopsis orientalis]